jgi:predicted N-formylglutamate amidohydrolase
MRSVPVIITCEHAGNDVPLRYRHLFFGAQADLESHRGWDPGALSLATYLSRDLHAPLLACSTTRLLVEPNRSLGSGELFSRYTRDLPEIERNSILDAYYFPHRKAAAALMRKAGHALHLSIHTFTPLLDGVVRKVDIGILFDPSRRAESGFCMRYRKRLERCLPALTIAFNKPYLGTDDGFTTYLRTQFSDDQYMGIEIEVNQQYWNTPRWEEIATALTDALVAED